MHIFDYLAIGLLVLIEGLLVLMMLLAAARRKLRNQRMRSDLEFNPERRHADRRSCIFLLT